MMICKLLSFLFWLYKIKVHIAYCTPVFVDIATVSMEVRIKGPVTDLHISNLARIAGLIELLVIETMES